MFINREEIIERMKKAINVKHDNKLAIDLNVSASTVSQYKKRLDESFNQHIIRFSQKHNISLDWIFYGIGPMKISSLLEIKESEMVSELPLEYGAPYTIDERKYLNKLIDILRGANEQNKVAIKTNIDSFHINRNEKIKIQEDYTKEIRSEDCEEGEGDIKKQQAG